jgi:hypothetical protein
VHDACVHDSTELEEAFATGVFGAPLIALAATNRAASTARPPMMRFI